MRTGNSSDSRTIEGIAGRSEAAETEMSDAMGEPHRKTPASNKRFLVFLDFDGTIAEGGVLLSGPKKAIAAAQDQGHLVFLNTGRSFREVPKEAWDAGFDGHVTSAGAFACVGEEIVHADTLLESDTERIVDVLDRRGLDFFLQYFDHMFATRRMEKRLDDLYSRGAYPVRPSHVVHKISTKNVARVVFAPPDGSGLRGGRLTEDLKRELGDGLRFHPGVLPGRGVSSGEISAASTSKASPFPALTHRFGVSPARVMAVGDEVNDLEMLRVAGLGVAMGDSPADVKEVADQVTSGSVERGVAETFLRNGLIAPDFRKAI